MSVRAKVVRAPSEAVLSEITRERFARLRRERNALRVENAVLVEALRALVAGIERAAATGLDLSGYIGTGRALELIARAEGRS